MGGHWVLSTQARRGGVTISPLNPSKGLQQAHADSLMCVPCNWGSQRIVTGSCLRNLQGKRWADELLKEEARAGSLHFQNLLGPRIHVCSIGSDVGHSVRAMIGSGHGLSKRVTCRGKQPSAKGSWRSSSIHRGWGQRNLPTKNTGGHHNHQGTGDSPESMKPLTTGLVFLAFSVPATSPPSTFIPPSPTSATVLEGQETLAQKLKMGKEANQTPLLNFKFLPGNRPGLGIVGGSFSFSIKFRVLPLSPDFRTLCTKLRVFGDLRITRNVAECPCFHLRSHINGIEIKRNKPLTHTI